VAEMGEILTAGEDCAHFAHSGASVAVIDADLTVLIEAWPGLSEDAQQAILRIVKLS